VKKFLSLTGSLAVLLLVLFTLGNAQSSTQPPDGVDVELIVSNEACQGGVQLTQILFLRNGQTISINLRLPATQIPVGSRQRLAFELNDQPTAVNLKGTIGGEAPLDVTAQVGTTQYQCGIVQLVVEGSTAQPSGVAPQPGTGAQLPPQLAGIGPGIGPQQALNQLQANGFDMQVQGTQANPKVGNADDILISSALGAGFLSGFGTWVSSGTFQLRSAVVWDVPSTSMVLIVISNVGGFCASVPPGGGGIALFCDRPGALAPTTTLGNGPVPGNVFLVLVLKIGGPTQPFVLSLAG